MCAYVSGSRDGLPTILYGNIAASRAKQDPEHNRLIEQLLDGSDDHDILQTVGKTNENSAKLKALKRGRRAYNEWSASRFSMLSYAEKHAFLKALRRVYCPKCLQKIDFKVQVR